VPNHLKFADHASPVCILLPPSELRAGAIELDPVLDEVEGNSGNRLRIQCLPRPARGIRDPCKPQAVGRSRCGMNERLRVWNCARRRPADTPGDRDSTGDRSLFVILAREHDPIVNGPQPRVEPLLIVVLAATTSRVRRGRKGRATAAGNLKGHSPSIMAKARRAASTSIGDRCIGFVRFVATSPSGAGVQTRTCVANRSAAFYIPVQPPHFLYRRGNAHAGPTPTPE